MKPSVLLPACELLWAAPGCFQERKSFVSGWYTLRRHLAPSLRSVDKTVERIFRINTVEIAEPCVGKVQLTFLTRMERSWTKSLRRLWRVWSSRAFDITREARGSRTFKIMSAVIGALLHSGECQMKCKHHLTTVSSSPLRSCFDCSCRSWRYLRAHRTVFSSTNGGGPKKVHFFTLVEWEMNNNLRCPDCEQLSA